MRATPKTSLPVPCAKLVRLTIRLIRSHNKKFGCQRTITGEGAEGDVLLSGGGSLLGSHCEYVDGGLSWMEYGGEEKSKSGRDQRSKKVGVCPRVRLHGDWLETSGKRVDRVGGLRHEWRQ